MKGVIPKRDKRQFKYKWFLLHKNQILVLNCVKLFLFMSSLWSFN